MRCRIDHTAAGREALELRRPTGHVQADTVADVATALREAEDAARRGCYVAGFVSYDAAPAFDAAFRVPSAAQRNERGANLPLAWFGFFAEARPAPPLPRVATDRDEGTGVAGWTCEIDATAHSSGVAAIHGAIVRGDAYLVNHTSRFRRPWSVAQDSYALYCRLVASYGRGYHAFLETDEWAVACGSPELFFEWSHGDLVSRPMKGTTPRGRWSDEDSSRAEALRTSPKERAQNVMVVDLLRNDLGRLAVPGSVTVPALWQVEQHPTLWQLTSSVQARATDAVGLAEVFGALFPCASVTGAPKVSAMSVIADLEPSRRGVYCGAMGLLEPSSGGAATEPVARFAVAIRTAVIDKHNEVAEYGSGGGITCDSSAVQEWDELILKAGSLAGPCAQALSAEHALLETMAYEPGGRGGSVRNLAHHLARMRASARYFGRAFPADAQALVDKAIAGLEEPTRLRLLLWAGGALDVETAPLDHRDPASPLTLCVDTEPVQSTEVTLFHKTTERRRYDERAGRHAEADDVVLVNERGEVTETTRANVAAYLGGTWCTPPLRSGLLPGVGRARALAAGRVVERVITVDELRTATAVATLSSLRGWRSARVRTGCSC